MPDGNSNTAASPAEDRTRKNQPIHPVVAEQPKNAKGIRLQITPGEIAARSEEIKGREEDLEDDPEIFTYTDLGNGHRFKRDHGDRVRYAAGGFYIWDGVKWIRDRGDKIRRLAKQTVQSIKSEPFINRDARKRHFEKSQSLRSVEAMIKMAQSEEPIPCELSEFDANDYLLTVPNGTIDLKTGELRDHSRSDFITHSAGVQYDPDARCNTFLEFLLSSQAGKAENVSYIQRLLGYSLTGATYEKIFSIIWGPTDAGKSVFMNTVRLTLGEYAGTTPSDTFAAKQSRGGRIPNDVARLRGLRMVIASESEQGDYLHEGLIKQLTGGDNIAARFLHQEFFEFRPAVKIWFVTNHVPRFHGGDSAIERRVRLVPFTVRVDRSKQDPELEKKMAAEAEGILAWMVRGCLEWQRIGLAVPESIAAATEKLLADNDDVGQFIDEKCFLEVGSRVGKSDLYKEYAGWAKDGSRGVLGQKAFNSAMEARGYIASGRKERLSSPLSSPQYFWPGIRLRMSSDPLESEESDCPF